MVINERSPELSVTVDVLTYATSQQSGVSFYEAETTGTKIDHAYPQRFPCTVACFCCGMGLKQVSQC